MKLLSFKTGVQLIAHSSLHLDVTENKLYKTC